MAKLEAAIAARQQEEEEERLKREQRKERAARTQQKEKVSEVSAAAAAAAVVLDAELDTSTWYIISPLVDLYESSYKSLKDLMLSVQGSDH